MPVRGLSGDIKWSAGYMNLKIMEIRDRDVHLGIFSTHIVVLKKRLYILTQLGNENGGKGQDHRLGPPKFRALGREGRIKEGG